MADGYEEVNIGPFVGGLNTLSDQTSIGDTELFQCDNFELDQDGSLVSRPPVRKTTVSLAAGKALKLLGYYIDTSTGNTYLIATDRSSTTYYLSGGVWTVLTATFAATACIQFMDKLYVLAPYNSAVPSGSWTPAGGFVAIANMAKGACIVQIKSRLFVAQGKNATTNGTRVYVSKLADPSLAWDYFDVSQGDGENVVDLCIYNSDIIIFKQKSTWRFSYGADPTTGYLTNISQTIGINDTGCWAAWEEELFTVFNDGVYEFSNYNYNRLNITVPLRSANPSAALTEKLSISAWASRVFVSYFEKLYVYNLKNRTWSTWSSSRVHSFGRFFPIPFQQSERPLAYIYSTQPAGTDGEANVLFQVVDIIENGNLADQATFENIVCTMETKNYDYQSPSVWKRLRFWGVDALTRADISVQAQPVLYGTKITWGTAKLRTWGTAKTYTWGRPADFDIVVADTVSISGLTGGRKFIKFLKSLRFRQISFKIMANTTGTIDTAPVRIYRLSTYVKEKELVARKLN